MRLILAVTLLSSFASSSFAREMSYRKDAAPMPGYNTGTGRFVDQDRTFAVELDAYTPTKASRSSDETNKVQEWGGEFQYNLKKIFVATEFWFGEYEKDGKSPTGARLAEGETYEILYNRFQLFVGAFSKKQQMKGWYAKGGYSFTKIDTEANLINESEGSTGSIYNNLDDSRHGMTFSAGHRLTFFKNYCSLNLGLSYTRTTSRSITGQNPTFQSRYESILANAGDKRLAGKDFPEIRVAVGVLF
jgi:hypothetical protein